MKLNKFLMIIKNNMIKVNIYNEQTGELDYLGSMDKTSNEIKTLLRLLIQKI